MHAYLLTGCLGNVSVPRYHGTLALAHAEAKSHIAIRPDAAPEIRIELVDIDTSKDSILNMLNDSGGFQRGGPIRTWRLGRRGGVVECPNGE